VGLFSALDTAASGMAAQRLRAQVLAENLANAETTRTSGGGPYQPKSVVFESVATTADFRASLAGAMNSGPGVHAREVVLDHRAPERRYVPGHPDADKDGYVLFPAVNPAEDMVDLMGASRGFQANVSAITALKDMIKSSIDLMR
jgi:flagellar basal-body rod protein FlgC